MVASIVITHCLCVISLSLAYITPAPRRQQGVVVSPSAPLNSHANTIIPSRAQEIVQSEQEAVMDIRAMMALLERTYPEISSGDNKQQRWTKTRKYLYQYRANASRANIAPEGQITRRKKRIRGPLTLSHIQQILSFLQGTFPNHPELQARILQKSPRILGQYRSIESRLVPTVEFLQELYGVMTVSDGKKGGMFHEAIWRNTNLLLVRGVGYAGRGSKGTDAMGGDDSNVSAVEAYLEQEITMPSSGIAKLKRNYPSLFQLSLNSKVKPVVKYLYSLLGHSDTATMPPQAKQKKQVSKILTNHPILLQLDVAANLEPTACFLREYCDLTDKELAMVIAATPGVLGLSVERNLKPTLQFISGVLKDGRIDHSENGGEEDSSKILLRKCILKHPQILALSLTNLSAKRDYFNGIDGDLTTKVADQNTKGPKSTLAARVLVSAPSAYSLSLTENIIPKIEYLASLWGMPASCTENSRSFLSDNLRENPQILTLSKEGNIIPTLSFYNMTGYVHLDSNGLPREQQSSMQQPKSIIRSRYIATSLYNRLLPRWHFLIEEQEKQQQLEQHLESLVNPKSKEASTPKYIIPTPKTSHSRAALPPLHLLAGASDDVFCRQMKLSLIDYLAFKEEAVPRLKFSSQFDRWLKTGRPIDLTATP